jgi:glycosyltransferase involved in cell wall biosynthesis
MTIRAVHVVPSIAPDTGGHSYSVPSLCQALTTAGVDVSLHVLARGASQERTGLTVHQHAEWCKFVTPLGVSPSMYRALKREAHSGTPILHNHSLWMMPNVYPGFAVADTRSLLVTSPRGVLDPWALRNSKWRKRLMLALLQHRTLDRSDCLHATAYDEYQYIRNRRLKAPVAVIPNGVDIPPLSIEPRPSTRRLIFLGRLVPKKRLDVLLRAWSAVSSRFPDWEVRVVGPDERGHQREMMDLAATLRAPRVLFRGPIYGADKWRELASASLFVLPTHTENFGVAVAEALASGVPAIVTQGAPWRGLEREACGWWIEHGVESLTATLEKALATSAEDLATMGRRGREWMQRDFSWIQIGQMMARTYAWLLQGGAAPEWVRVD